MTAYATGAIAKNSKPISAAIKMIAITGDRIAIAKIFVSSFMTYNSGINETPCLVIHLRQDLFITLILFVIQQHREILSRYFFQINGTPKYAHLNAAVDRMSGFEEKF